MKNQLGYKLNIKKIDDKFDFFLNPIFEKKIDETGWFGQAFQLCKNCGGAIYHMMIAADLCNKCGLELLEKLNDESFKNYINFNLGINTRNIFMLNKKQELDIGIDTIYPAKELSNFSEYNFSFDNIECNSMEGLLQSFKCPDKEKQIKICLLSGTKAKFKGKKFKWYLNQKLYWQGKEYKRDSDEYQKLLDRAFEALSDNKDFRFSLKNSFNLKLIHSIGKNQTNLTVLTNEEFCQRLMKIRKNLGGV